MFCGWFPPAAAFFIGKAHASVLFVTISGDDVALFGQIHTMVYRCFRMSVPKVEAEPIVNRPETSLNARPKREREGVSLIGRN